MTKKICFILCVFMVSAVMLITVGCKKESSVDLKGQSIVIGNFWADYDTDTFEPQNEGDERTLEWRKKIEKDNGFRMYEKYIAGFNDFLSTAALSIMTDEPAADIFVMQGKWVISLMFQGLVYPVSENSVVDLKNPQFVASGQRAPEWNQSVINAFEFNGINYGFGFGTNLSNANVVFFNKRLFREAGLDPNLPYDMQKDGTWTWDNFIDICKQLTRDINNDGIIDTYAMPRDHSSEILSAVLASNGAQFVGRDSDGRFINVTNRPEFLESLQYVMGLHNEGVMKPPPEGANWDWFKAEFADGNVAMRIDESYVWQELGNMRDDWGMVLFPKGPRSSIYRVSTHDNILVIPATYSREKVDQILYAAALWHTPQTDDWKSGLYYAFRDSRAVDETLALIRDPKSHVNKNYNLVPGFERGDVAWQMWYHEGDPAQLVEAASENWNALIEDLNYGIFEAEDDY